MKTLPINDLRKTVTVDLNTSIVGHQPGDVIVNRVKRPGDGVNVKDGLLELYDIQFYKNYNGKLKSYLLSFNDPEDYDQVSYQWISDTEVSVNIVSSVSHKNRTLRLAQVGDKVKIMNGPLDR